MGGLNNGRTLRATCLIERYWRFLHNKCLYSQYYPDFKKFKKAIEHRICFVPYENADELESLLTWKFQSFKKVQTKPFKVYGCYWHRASSKTRQIKGHEKCSLPSIPAELLEWQVFYVELFKQLGLEPENYKALLDGKNGLDGKIKEHERKLSYLEAGMRRKKIVLRNLDSLLERDDFDRAAYSQKRHGCLLEIHALRRKMEETRKELEELRQRKTEKVEFAKFVSQADQIKDLTHAVDLPVLEHRMSTRAQGLGLRGTCGGLAE